jgi:hypothetical protein
MYVFTMCTVAYNHVKGPMIPTMIGMLTHLQVLHLGKLFSGCLQHMSLPISFSLLFVECNWKVVINS